MKIVTRVPDGVTVDGSYTVTAVLDEIPCD
jgi:hypothetical protein